MERIWKVFKCRSTDGNDDDDDDYEDDSNSNSSDEIVDCGDGNRDVDNNVSGDDDASKVYVKLMMVKK